MFLLKEKNARVRHSENQRQSRVNVSFTPRMSSGFFAHQELRTVSTVYCGRQDLLRGYGFGKSLKPLRGLKLR